MLCYTTQCQVPYIATHKDVATKLTRSCLTHILVDNGNHKINFFNFLIEFEPKKSPSIYGQTYNEVTLSDKKMGKKKALVKLITSASS